MACDGVLSFLPVGIPVRRPERLLPSRARERMALELPKGGRIVGVAGGSLGSRDLVERALAAAAFFERKGDDVVFLFLGDPPGPDLPPNVRFVGRQWNMNPFYSLCDVLICRAGGSTLAEALSWGIPAVVVPWERAAEGHGSALTPPLDRGQELPLQGPGESDVEVLQGGRQPEYGPHGVDVDAARQVPEALGIQLGLQVPDRGPRAPLHLLVRQFGGILSVEGQRLGVEPRVGVVEEDIEDRKSVV